MTAKIAVLVSGGGTNLQALIDAQQRSELGGGEITAVISSKEGAYALERARKAGIPRLCAAPEKLRLQPRHDAGAGGETEGAGH